MSVRRRRRWISYGTLDLLAPTLAWDNEGSDLTPDFTCTFTDGQVNDSVTLEIHSSSPTLNAPSPGTLVDSDLNVLDAGEVAAETASFSLSELSVGTYYARVLHARAGWTSAYSNVVSFTLTSYSTARTFLNLWDTEGFCVDFEDGSMSLIDSVTPANNYEGAYSSKLTIVGTLTAAAGGPTFNNSNYASLPVSAFNWSSTNGTLFVDYTTVTVTSAIRFAVNCANTSASDQAWIGQSAVSGIASGTRLMAVSTASSTVQAALIDVAISATNYKTALAIKAGDFAASYNGNTAVTDGTGNMPALSTGRNFWFGSRNGSFGLDGKIKKVLYVPRRLTNAELASITA